MPRGLSTQIPAFAPREQQRQSPAKQKTSPRHNLLKRSQPDWANSKWLIQLTSFPTSQAHVTIPRLPEDTETSHTKPKARLPKHHIAEQLPQPRTRPRRACHLRDGVNHVEPHLYAAVGVVSLGLGEARHAVVAVTKDLDAATVVLLRGQSTQSALPAQQVDLVTTEY